MKQFEAGRVYSCQCAYECGMMYKVVRRDKSNIWIKLAGYKHQCAQRMPIKRCLGSTEYVEPEKQFETQGPFIIAAHVQPVADRQEVML
jgi:hypothetical protein